MDEPLFRPEVIKNHSYRLYGKVVIKQPLTVKILTSIVAIITISLIYFLMNGSYSRREIAKGYLVPNKGLVKVYATASGLVKDLNLKQGQRVEKDQLLMSVATLKKDINGSDRDEKLLRELEAQRENLEHLKTEEINRYKIDDKKLLQKIIGLEQEQVSVTESTQLILKRIALLNSKLEKVNKLYSEQFVSETSLDEVKQQILELRSRLNSLHQQDIQLKTSIEELKSKRLVLPIEHKQKLVELKQKKSSINQQVLELKSRRTYSIHAPISGKIAAIHVNTGQQVSTQLPAVVILPEGSKLQAALFLPTRAVGFINNQQSVLLRFNAFPYQHYGSYHGIVDNITKTILTPREIPIPLAIEEPVYRVEVNLDDQNIKAFGKTYALQSGMLLEADIILDKRTFIEWILEPIYGLFGDIKHV